MGRRFYNDLALHCPNLAKEDARKLNKLISTVFWSVSVLINEGRHKQVK